MRILITIFFIVSILGCIPKAKNQQKGFEKIAPLEENNSVAKQEIKLDDYSKEFSKYFIENNMILKGDSIVILTNGRSEIVRIPTYIKRDSTIQFSSEKEQSISVSQINYNEIRFTIVNGNEKVEGRASLLPHFYLGSETIGFHIIIGIVIYFHDWIENKIGIKNVG